MRVFGRHNFGDDFNGALAAAGLAGTFRGGLEFLQKELDRLEVALLGAVGQDLVDAGGAAEEVSVEAAPRGGPDGGGELADEGANADAEGPAFGEEALSARGGEDLGQALVGGFFVGWHTLRRGRTAASPPNTLTRPEGGRTMKRMVSSEDETLGFPPEGVLAAALLPRGFTASREGKNGRTGRSPILIAAAPRESTW